MRVMDIGSQNLIVLLMVAGLMGVIGQRLVGCLHSRLLASTALSFIGGLIGAEGASRFQLPELLILQIGYTSFPVGWEIAGAAAVFSLFALLKRRQPAI